MARCNDVELMGRWRDACAAREHERLRMLATAGDSDWKDDDTWVTADRLVHTLYWEVVRAEKMEKVAVGARG